MSSCISLLCMYLIGKPCIDLFAYCHDSCIASYTDTKTGPVRTAFGCQNQDLDHFLAASTGPPQDHVWLPKLVHPRTTFGCQNLSPDQFWQSKVVREDWFWPGPLFACQNQRGALNRCKSTETLIYTDRQTDRGRQSPCATTRGVMKMGKCGQNHTRAGSENYCFKGEPPETVDKMAALSACCTALDELVVARSVVEAG